MKIFLVEQFMDESLRVRNISDSKIFMGENLALFGFGDSDFALYRKYTKP